MTAYRSLLERLRTLADHLPPSHVVGERPSERVLAALVHYIEFGEKLLNAADDDAQHVADDLAKSPDQRSVAKGVVGVLTEPFPTPRSAEESAANQDAKLAALQAQVDQLLAARDELPTQTAAGAPLPQTSVSTDEPELQTPVEHNPEPVNTEQAPPSDLPSSPTFASDVFGQPGTPAVPSDAPAPAANPTKEN